MLLEACVPASEFGAGWPAGVPVQVHGMEHDPFFGLEGDVDAARELVASVDDGELFVYPGDVHLFIPASMDTSFPSDHATAAFAIAGAIFLRSRRAGWIALTMASLVSVGRVVGGTHYPTDVLAGAAIGTLSALVFCHPRVRGPLHALADRAGAIYEGVVLRRPQTG